VVKNYTKQHLPPVVGKNRFDELELVKNIVRRCPQPDPTLNKNELSKKEDDNDGGFLEYQQPEGGRSLPYLSNKGQGSDGPKTPSTHTHQTFHQN
jgi:hypothetical protein